MDPIFAKYRHLIDSSCPEKFRSLTHIHRESNGDFLWCTLNQTDLETNSNKYYIMQLLKHDKMNSYFLINRSGRVGYENKKDFKCFLNEEKAIEEFKKVFNEKTGYLWSERLLSTSTRRDGKYGFVEMEVDKDPIVETKIESSSTTQVIDHHVETLINLIFDLKIYTSLMSTYKIDTAKAPLGKISSNQIKKAYGILSQIQEQIKLGTSIEDKSYKTLSSAFYTLIPTSYGTQKLPILSTEEQFKEKCDLLDILSEMEVAGKIMSSIVLDSSRTWNQYLSLQSEIKPLEDSTTRGLIQKYFDQTHGSTHSVNMKIREMYEINRNGEDDRFAKTKGCGNRQLLWHGSRLTNIVGIISQGLRIAPPEAPKTGYMFGKGVYFANSVSKSANYMYITAGGSGVIFLCEVALGETYQLKQSLFVTDLPQGYHSTWGLGQNTPNVNETSITKEGLIIPLGKLVSSGRSGLSLMYDEFIVYDVNQIRIRYALVLDMK
jgi:predicted DNA-binding WGR domain protein